MEETAVVANDDTGAMDSIGEEAFNNFQEAENNVELPQSVEEDAQPQTETPVEIDYALPEGIEGVDQADLYSIIDAAKEMGLSNENAIILAKNRKTIEAETVARVTEDLTKQMSEEIAPAWKKAEQEYFAKENDVIKTQMGAEEYTSMVANANRVYEKVKNPAFRKMIENGQGQNPAIIAAFSELFTTLMKEDSTNVGEINTKQKPKLTTAEKIFG